jgi:hypothetical protein
MSPQARMAAGNAPLPEAGSPSSDAGAGPFVINLTSSTTPMALAHPDSPELKRFSFFVSRRREDNRERFRLHMGYFSTLAEAEEWLNVIRDLYPGAWAGEAPGKKLRARAAAAELAKQLPPPPAPRQFAPPPQSTARAASVAARAPAAKPAAPVAAPAAAVAKPSAADLVVPTLKAAPPSYPPAPQATVAPSAAPMLEAVAQAAAALAAVAKTAVAQSVTQTPPAEITYVPPAPPASRAPASQPVSFNAPMPTGSTTSAGVPAASRAVAAAAAAAAAAARPAQGGRPGTGGAQSNQAAQANSAAQSKAGAQSKAPQPKAAASAAAPAAAAPGRPGQQQPPAKSKRPNALTGSNVREVMASLDETSETGETRIMRMPPGVAGLAQSAKGSPAASAPAARNAGGPAGRAPSASPQTARGPAPSAPARAAATAGGDSMSDTQVLRMLEARRPDNGERVGDDANSGISLLKPDDTQTRRALKEAVIDNAPVSFAVQLQWSVQPVDLAQVPPLAIFSAYTLYTVEGSREGRKWYGLRLGFFSDAISAKQVAYYVRSEFASVAVVPVSPAEKSRASESEAKTATGAFQRKHVDQKMEEFKLFDDEKPAVPAPPPKAAEPAPAKPAAAKSTAPTRKNRVKAKEQRSPKTLEETLEILGASDLEIDNGRGELLNDTGVRHLRVEVQKNTPFGKLLDRISERVRKN